jgi:hypothetical protein
MVMVRDGPDECSTIPMPSTKPQQQQDPVIIEYHAQRLADYTPQHVGGAFPPMLLYQVFKRATFFQVNKLVT